MKLCLLRNFVLRREKILPDSKTKLKKWKKKSKLKQLHHYIVLETHSTIMVPKNADMKLVTTQIYWLRRGVGLKFYEILKNTKIYIEMKIMEIVTLQRKNLKEKLKYLITKK